MGEPWELKASVFANSELCKVRVTHAISASWHVKEEAARARRAKDLGASG
jgi:hypothetical protein